MRGPTTEYELGSSAKQSVNSVTANATQLIRILEMNESNWAERLAEGDGKEAIARARAALVRALEEIDLYSEKYDAAENSRRRAEVLNWTLHYLSTGITPNLRLDLLANAQARLTCPANH